MVYSQKVRPSGASLWAGDQGRDVTTSKVEQILGAAVGLPLRYWKPRMFFTGAKDEDLLTLTEQKFPHKMVPRKTHPIFALHALAGDVGFKVCPCSSKRQHQQRAFRYIKKGCRLLHKNCVMDRNSYLIGKISFNIPRSIAFRLRFRGEVPIECLKMEKANKVGQ